MLRFARDFPITLLPAITTPRLAVRLANSIAFALPLLRGEVNIVDLIFLEGIKVLYSESYDAVKHNPDLFIKSFNDGIVEGPDNRKVKQLTMLIDTMIEPLPRLQAYGLKALLKELFPNAMLTSHANVEFAGFEDKDKRAGDINYFNRYFSYTLQPGEISDITFSGWLQVAANGCDNAEIIAGMKKIIEISSVEKFLYKLRLQENTLSWDTGTTLAKALVREGDFFYSSGSVLMSKLISEPRWQLGFFISNIMSKFLNESNHLIIAKELLQIASPFSFSADLHRQFTFCKNEGKQVFDDSQLRELSLVLVERGRNLSHANMLWETFPDLGANIVRHWFDIDADQVESYITEWISPKPARAVELLTIFVNIIHDSLYPDQPYQGDLDAQDYGFLIQITPPDLIMQRLRQKYSDIELYNENATKWYEHHGPFQTDLNLARQFAYWDKKMKEKSQNLISKNASS